MTAAEIHFHRMTTTLVCFHTTPVAEDVEASWILDFPDCLMLPRSQRHDELFECINVLTRHAHGHVGWYSLQAAHVRWSVAKRLVHLIMSAIDGYKHSHLTTRIASELATRLLPL